MGKTSLHGDSELDNPQRRIYLDRKKQPSVTDVLECKLMVERGDSKAFERLVQSYKRYINHYALSFINGYHLLFDHGCEGSKTSLCFGSTQSTSKIQKR